MPAVSPVIELAVVTRLFDGQRRLVALDHVSMTIGRGGMARHPSAGPRPRE